MREFRRGVNEFLALPIYRTVFIGSLQGLGQPIGPIFKGKEVTLMTGPTGCTETSVTKCQPTLRNIPEEQRPEALVWCIYTHTHTHMYTLFNHAE